MTKMFRVAFAAVAVALTVGSLQAQAPAPGSEKLVGAWEGSFSSDGPSGPMTLKVSKSGTDWKVELGMGPEVPPGGDATDVAVDGKVLSWKQAIGEFLVSFKATLSDDGEGLNGNLEAQQGGTVVGGGTFTLKRKAT